MEKVKEKCKVVMLPTNNPNYDDNKANQLGKHKNGTLMLCKGFDKEIEKIYNPQHLYIISDEEIKEEDYLINLDNNIITKSTLKIWGKDDISKKIIASTDRSLGLPTVSESFIKAYCKANGKIDEVMVEYEIMYSDVFTTNFPINVLKTNSKNEISITKIKDNYTREEVIRVLRMYDIDSNTSGIPLEDWITCNI